MWNIPNVVAVAGRQRQQLPEGGNGKSVPMSVGIIPRFAVLACVRVRNMPVTSSRFSYGLFWGDRTGAQGKQTMIPRKGLNLSFYDHTNCVCVHGLVPYKGKILLAGCHDDHSICRAEVRCSKWKIRRKRVKA